MEETLYSPKAVLEQPISKAPLTWQIPSAAGTSPQPQTVTSAQMPLPAAQPKQTVQPPYSPPAAPTMPQSTAMPSAYAQMPQGVQPSEFAQMPFSQQTAMPSPAQASPYAQMPVSWQTATPFPVQTSPYAQLPFGAQTITPDIVRSSVPRSMQEVYDASLQATIQNNLGYYVIIEFLIGNNIVDKEGILYAGGSDYVTIYDIREDRYIVCDFFSIKFITFYNTKTIPPSRLNGGALPASAGKSALNRNVVYRNGTMYSRTQWNSGRTY